MDRDRAYRLWRFWNSFLCVLAVIPLFALYDTWRGDDRSDVWDPRTIALVVTWEAVVVWYARRRGVWWFPRRRTGDSSDASH